MSECVRTEDSMPAQAEPNWCATGASHRMMCLSCNARAAHGCEVPAKPARGTIFSRAERAFDMRFSRCNRVQRRAVHREGLEERRWTVRARDVPRMISCARTSRSLFRPNPVDVCRYPTVRHHTVTWHVTHATLNAGCGDVPRPPLSPVPSLCNTHLLVFTRW